MIKISNSSKLIIGHLNAKVIVRSSIDAFVVLIVLIIVAIDSLMIIYYEEEKLEWGPKWFWLLIGFGIFAKFFFEILLVEVSEIDLIQRIVIRKKKVFGLCFKEVITNWPSQYIFKYEVEYDYYNDISAIWLVAFSLTEKQSWRIMRFKDKRMFVNFQKSFNESFPEYKIAEWHD